MDFGVGGRRDGGSNPTCVLVHEVLLSATTAAEDSTPAGLDRVARQGEQVRNVNNDGPDRLSGRHRATGDPEVVDQATYGLW